MSVVETILENLESTLDGIQQTKGFETSVKLATREPFDPFGLSESETPAIRIVDSEDEKPYSPIEDDNGVIYQRQMIPVHLFVYIKRAELLSKTFNLFVADLRKALAAASLGANVIDFDLRESDRDDGDQDRVVDYLLEIDYYYSEASP